MKLMNMTCPNCGAQLKIDEGKKVSFCGHCGTQILIDDEVQHVQYDNAEAAGYEFEKGRQRAQEELGQTGSYSSGQGYGQPAPKKSGKKTWLWVLGWICIFPVPLTILLVRKKNWNPIIKYGTIAVAWLFYLIIAFSGRGSDGSGTETTDRAVSNEMVSSDDSSQDSQQSESAANIRRLDILHTDDYEVEVGMSTSESWVNASVKDKGIFKPEDVVFVSENPEIAKIEYSHDALTTYLYYSITGVSNGETYVYAQNEDGSVVSDKVRVIVTGDSIDAAETVDGNTVTVESNKEATETKPEPVETKPESVQSEISDVITPVVTNTESTAGTGERSVSDSTTKEETTAVYSVDNPSTDVSSNTEPAPSVESSTSTNSGNADAFHTYDNPEQQQTSESWVLNTNSMKIHYPKCRYVPEISPENYATSSSSLDELKAQGYTTCGVCFR